MGYMRHHALAVTSWHSEKLAEAHAEAARLFGTLVTPIVGGAINNEASFFVAPDGSKEGWSDSDEGDRLRAEFTLWLKARAEDDGSSVLAWVEVQYGDDYHEAKVCDASDWQQRREHANAAEAAVLHPITEYAIEELMLNLRNNCGLRELDSVVRYGVVKVATYAAQVARAQALGIDPDEMRETKEGEG